jgi:hypothetical protein
MSKKTRQFVAIVALIFMAGFIVFGMMYLLDKTLLNGAVGFGALFCGAFTLALYLVIIFDNKYGEEGTKKRIEEARKLEEEARKESEQDETDDSASAPENVEGVEGTDTDESEKQ